MSSQAPPIPFPLNSTFNYSDWSYTNDIGLTISQGDARYILKTGDSASGLINFNAGLTTLFATVSQNLNFTNGNVYINNDGSDNMRLVVGTGNSVNVQSPLGTTRFSVSSTQATSSVPFVSNGTAQFNSTVSIGSTSTPNLSPTINTYYSQVNLGNGGLGSINLQCPMNVGGFGSFSMTSSTLNMNSNSRINQSLVTSANILSQSIFTTNYGSSATIPVEIVDSVANQGFYFMPNSGAGSYNPSVSAGNIVLVGKGTNTGTGTILITPWGSTNSAVKLSNGNAVIGAGGTSTVPTTSMTLDGTNIAFSGSNYPTSNGALLPTATNDTHLCTTQWVQSLFATIPTPSTIIPYFRFSQLTNVNSNRQGTPFGFQFNGASGWTNQDFFTIRLSVSCITANNANNFNLTCVMDIFPALCPANTAYGSTSGNATTVGSSPFVNLNGNIWSGSQYYSTFSVPIDATYCPLGRWFNPTSYQVVNNLNTAQQPNCLPLYPYITNATQKTNFGFQLWALSTVANQNIFSVTCEVIGNTTTNAITSYGVTQFSNNYSTF